MLNQALAITEGKQPIQLSQLDLLKRIAEAESQDQKAGKTQPSRPISKTVRKWKSGDPLAQTTGVKKDVKQLSVKTPYGTTTRKLDKAEQAQYAKLDGEGRRAFLERIQQEAIEVAKSRGLKPKEGRETATRAYEYEAPRTTEGELTKILRSVETVLSPSGANIGRGIAQRGIEAARNVLPGDTLPEQFIAGMAENTLYPGASFVEATGNLYDPTATIEERLGAAGNVGLYGLGAVSGVSGARQGIQAARAAGMTGRQVLKEGVRGAIREGTMLGGKLVGDTPAIPRPANFDLESINTQLDQAIGNVQTPSNVIQSLPGVEKPLTKKQQKLNELKDLAKLASSEDDFIASTLRPTSSPNYVGNSHRAPYRDAEGYHKPVSDVTGLFPNDIYTDPRAVDLYSSGLDPEIDKKAIQIIRQMRNNPKGKVTIFRSVPKSAPDEIQPGDWVTLTREYADIHGQSNLNNDYKIIKKTVQADEVFTDANSIQEWGYDPKPLFNESQLRKIYRDTIKQTQTVPQPKTIVPKPVTETPVSVTKTPIVPPDITGVSNNIQLSKVEQGILDVAPVGRGVTRADMDLRVKDAGARIDSGEINVDAVADAVQGGKAFDVDTLAIIQAGNRRKEAIVRQLNTQLDNAIASGDKELIQSLQKQVDQARKDHLDFAEKVQVGKSAWADVGRLLAQGTDIDSDTLTGIVANAQRISGKTFDQLPESAKLTEIGKQLEDVSKRLSDLEAENSNLKTLIAGTKTAPKKSGKADIQARRAKAIENIKTKWAENAPEARISSDPLMAGRAVEEVSRLAKIAPDVLELTKTYIDEGIEVASDIIRRIKDDTGVEINESEFNQILAGEFPKPQKQGPITRQQATLKRLRDQAKNSTGARKARLEKSIRKLQSEIESQILPSKKPERVPTKEEKDLLIKKEALRVQRDDIMRKLKEDQERELNPVGTWAKDIANIPRTLVLSLDNSAALTHGGWLAYTHPFTWLKATGRSFKALLSEEARVNQLARIRNNPYYDKAVVGRVAGIAGRDLRDASPYPEIIERIPWIGKPFKASSRAMEVFSASARMDLFASMVKAQDSRWMKMFTKAEPDYKAIGEVVNTMTGKGTGKIAEGLTRINETAPLLTAPGFMVSRWKLALGSPLFTSAIRKNPRLAAQVVADYGKFAGSIFGALYAAEKMGAEVDWDPDSNNGWEFKPKGSNVWIDPSFGILAPVKLLYQIRPGHKVNETIKAGYYLSGRVSPPVRAAMNYKAGADDRKVFGKSYDIETPEGRFNSWFQFLPLSIQQSKEIAENPNLTNEQKTALALASFIGANVREERPNEK